jgi:hypothetical protein
MSNTTPLIEEDRLSFYFKVRGDKKIYNISYDAIELIPYFHSMVTSNPEQNITEETALELPTIIVPGDHGGYLINTRELLDVIDQYVQIWKDDIKAENYIKEDYIVQTNHADSFLKPQDLDLIRLYIDHRIEEAPIDCKKMMSESVMFKKFYMISVLSPLLENTDAYLQMDGFAHKIYSYCASVLWDCSLLEISEAQNNEFHKYFSQLQEKSVEEWAIKHKEKEYLINHKKTVV